MGFLVKQVVFAAPSDEAAKVVLHEGPPAGIVCDPGPVGLCVLEAILTKKRTRDIPLAQPVALFNGGQKFVLPLSVRLRDELATLRGWRAIRTVNRWSRSDEVRAERLSIADTHALVHELHQLATSAASGEEGLYFWVDVDERALF